MRKQDLIRAVAKQTSKPESQVTLVVNAVIAAIAGDERLRATIERLGDTAFQSRLLAPLMAHALRPVHLSTLAGPMMKIVRYGLRALWDDGIPAEENGDGEVNP